MDFILMKLIAASYFKHDLQVYPMLRIGIVRELHDIFSCGEEHAMKLLNRVHSILKPSTGYYEIGADVEAEEAIYAAMTV